MLSTNSAFSIIENDSFLNLISYVSCDQAQIVTTKTLMGDLSTKYEKIKIILKERIDNSKYLCLTADGWSNQSRSYMGVTIHFFDDKLKKRSFLLGFRRMFGRHTYEAIKDILLKIIKDFKINLSKIRHIVTDGASNFEKAFKVYGTMDDESIDEQETNDEENVYDVVDDEATVDDLFESEADTIFIPPGTEPFKIDLNNSFDDDDDIDRLPQQLKCYSHSLNRLGIDFDKAIKIKEKKGHDILESGYNKLKKLWTLCKRSSVANEIVESTCGRSFPQPISTRWNYKTDSIEQAEKYKIKINESIDEINQEAKRNGPKGKKATRLDKITKISNCSQKHLNKPKHA